MSFKVKTPPKEDKPRHRVVMESIAISRFVSSVGRAPKNKTELVEWVKKEYGSSAEVS